MARFGAPRIPDVLIGLNCNSIARPNITLAGEPWQSQHALKCRQLLILLSLTEVAQDMSRAAKGYASPVEKGINKPNPTSAPCMQYRMTKNPPLRADSRRVCIHPGEGLTPGEVVFLPAAAAAAAAVAAVPLAADDGAGAAAVDKAAVLAAAAVALELLLASPCAASAAAVAAVDTVAAVPFDPAKAAPEVADNAAKDAAVAAPDAVAAVELAEPFEAAAVGDRAANAAAVAACDAAVVLALLPAVDDSTDKAAADAACCAAVA